MRQCRLGRFCASIALGLSSFCLVTIAGAVTTGGTVRTMGKRAGGPVPYTYSVTHQRGTATAIEALNSTGAIVATIVLEQIGSTYAGVYDAGAGGDVTFLWHPTSGWLSISESGARQGVIRVNLATRRWTGDEMSLYVLSRLDRELEVIVGSLAKFAAPGPERRQRAPLLPSPNVIYPIPPCDPEPCGGGGGGACNGHYMIFQYRFCCQGQWYFWAYTDPYQPYEQGYADGGQVCNGACTDEVGCDNPY